MNDIAAPALMGTVFLGLMAVAAAVVGVLTSGTPRVIALVLAGLLVFLAAASAAVAASRARSGS